MPVEAVAPVIVCWASDGCSETNRIYNVEAGAIQRIAIVMDWLPRSTSDTREHRRELRKVESIERFTEPVRRASVRDESANRFEQSEALVNLSWRYDSFGAQDREELTRANCLPVPLKGEDLNNTVGVSKVPEADIIRPTRRAGE